MANSISPFARHFLNTARTALIGPQLLTFVPALILVGFWFGAQIALLSVAIAVPTVVALVGLITPRPAISRYGGPTDAITDLDHGARASQEILQHARAQILSVLRDNDLLARLDGPRFAIAFAPSPRPDLETMLQIASRLQEAVSQSITVDGLRLFLSVSVGFCVPRNSAEKTGEFCLDAAETALADAQTVGCAAIRAYASQTRRPRIVQSGLARDVAQALENGQILPWFQPQLSTDTGKVSGVEALARWIHPDHGVISPGAFLPAVSAAGLSTRLSEIILYHSLGALQRWDASGLFVPNVGVNFSGDDLSDPKLCDKIQWELDRFEMEPTRLTVEILETVIAKSDNDIIVRNIAKLAKLGCRIDLDDFGTGHASIANIRRFFVNRIKIDRSFVSQIDTDRQQQQMLTAILELTNRLDIEALAEGVESAGEHTLLAQLGCGHVQGYHIAKAMPLEETSDWLKRQSLTMARCPEITKRKGA